MVVAAPRILTRAARRLRRGCAAMLALATAAAVAQGDGELLVTGQCRDGLAQGGYSARSSDGRLRVQGAFNQGQRTGSFFFWSATGARVAQLPFDADALSGTLSLWYDAGPAAEPAVRVEAAYRDGRRDGITRWWYPGGGVHAEVDYAADVVVSARSWSEAGAAQGENEARAAAQAERRDTDGMVAGLLGTLRRHPPDCRGAPPAQRAAGPSAPAVSFSSTEARSAA